MYVDPVLFKTLLQNALSSCLLQWVKGKNMLTSLLFCRCLFHSSTGWSMYQCHVEHFIISWICHKLNLITVQCNKLQSCWMSKYKLKMLIVNVTTLLFCCVQMALVNIAILAWNSVQTNDILQHRLLHSEIKSVVNLAFGRFGRLLCYLQHLWS